jgi:hypothetical protein
MRPPALASFHFLDVKSRWFSLLADAARISPARTQQERTMACGVVRLLGWLVIAQGLSHAMLPLRGAIGLAVLLDDVIPAGLYGFGMVGFVAAGLGLLGVTPLARAISPLLVLASGFSLIAIVRFADASLWFGAVCDVALLLVGLWRAQSGWRVHPRHGRMMLTCSKPIVRDSFEEVL